MRVVSLLLLALSACDGGSADAPVLADVQDQAFKGCALSSCHGAGTGGLTLDGTAADHDRLVGAASTGDPSKTLVVAGDADASYLVAKLEGAAGIVGDTMPPGSTLSDENLQLVRDWIDGGALP